MESANLGIVLAQVESRSLLRSSARPSARTAEAWLWGDSVTAAALGAPNGRGQMLYEVSWRGVKFLTARTDQAGPEPWLRGALERAWRVSLSSFILTREL
jgi:hypothetical protein